MSIRPLLLLTTALALSGPLPARAGDADSRAVVAALTQALKDEDPQVRRVAASTLGRTREPAVWAALAEVLRSDPNADVRTEAAEALAGVQDPRAVEALLAAVKDSSVRVRRAAVGALAGVGSGHGPHPHPNPNPNPNPNPQPRPRPEPEGAPRP